MDKLRVGLIGIGGMGGCHYSCYPNVKTAQLVAVADVREDVARAKTKGEQRVYTDYKQMLDNEQLDMVDICSPSYLHADMVIECLNRGLHVICEKPMTLTAADCTRVLAAAKNSGKKFMVAHVVRFMTEYIVLADAIRSGKYGKLQRLMMRRLSEIPTWGWDDWFRDETRSGGVITDLAIHDVDFVQSVLGAPDGYSATWRPIRDNSSFANIVMNYGDTVVTVDGTWFNAKLPFTAEYLAVFENGYLELKAGKLVDNGTPVALDAAPKVDLGININTASKHQTEIEYFIDCILNDTDPDYVTPESSAFSVSLCEDIKKKAALL